METVGDRRERPSVTRHFFRKENMKIIFLLIIIIFLISSQIFADRNGLSFDELSSYSDKIFYVKILKAEGWDELIKLEKYDIFGSDMNLYAIAEIITVIKGKSIDTGCIIINYNWRAQKPSYHIIENNTYYIMYLNHMEKTNLMDDNYQIYKAYKVVNNFEAISKVNENYYFNTPIDTNDIKIKPVLNYNNYLRGFKILFPEKLNGNNYASFDNFDIIDLVKNEIINDSFSIYAEQDNNGNIAIISFYLKNRNEYIQRYNLKLIFKKNIYYYKNKQILKGVSLIFKS